MSSSTPKQVVQIRTSSKGRSRAKGSPKSDKGDAPAIAIEDANDHPKLEGNFREDFTNMCKRNNFTFIPDIVPRSRTPMEKLELSRQRLSRSTCSLGGASNFRLGDATSSVNKRPSQLFYQSAEGRGETAGRSRIRLAEDRQALRTLQGSADGRTDPGSSKAGREEGQPSVTFHLHKKPSSGKLPDLRTERSKIRRDSSGKRPGAEGRQSGKDGALKKGQAASGGLATDTPRQGRGKQEDGALGMSFQTSSSGVAKRGSQICVVDSVSDGTTGTAPTREERTGSEGDKLGLVFPKIVEQQSYTSFNMSTKDVNFFTPSIQVEHDNADDGRTVTEIYIRGWEVELAMLEVLLRCWVPLPLLRLVQLWNVALDSGTVTLLGSQLPFCYSLHTLVLDANSLRDMPVSLLLGPSSVLRHLSLRFCRLTDIEAYGISQGLVSPVSTNACLLSLNLSNNQITNVGVTHIAQSLRCNSSLLTLNLASNKVGDEGVVQLSTTFSKFPLTHNQLVQRRQIMSQRLEKENIRPTISHQSPSPSHVSPHREKEKDGHRDKDTHMKERDSLKRGRELIREPRDPKEGKDKEVKDKSKFSILKKKLSKDHLVGSKDVVDSHSKQKQLEPRLRLSSKKPRSKRSIQELPDEIMSPLIVDGEVRDGQLWITGNRSVISLNLSRNLIGKQGVKALRMAVEVQRETHIKIPNVAVGLLRIVLHRNSVAESDEEMQAINKILHCRDPCLKVPRINLQRVNITPCSLPLAL